MNQDLIKNKLFSLPFINDIDDDLILLSITTPSTRLNPHIKNRLNQKFGIHHNDRLELLGDAVLELAITQMLMDEGLTKVGDISQLRQKIVRNISLICLMNDLNLCPLNQPVKKDCADFFEAILGAIYTHLNQYDINVMNVIIHWLNEVWNMKNLIKDLMQHPHDLNLCEGIQRQYQDILEVSQPYFDYILDNYKKLEKIYHYYHLGKIEMNEQLNKNGWTIKIVCPLTLGCQYYADKQGDKIYLSVVTNKDKQKAIAMAAQEAADIILNDYNLL